MYGIHRRMGCIQRRSGHDYNQSAVSQGHDTGQSSGIKTAIRCIFIFSSMFPSLNVSTTFPDDDADGAATSLMSWLWIRGSVG